MEQCENCGNEYKNAFEVIIKGKKHTFDSFECAINTLAPVCKHCLTKIIGHGVESAEGIFCCASCAKSMGVHDLRDGISPGTSQAV